MLTKLTAAIHSSTVISFSLAKSCKCLNKLGMTCASLGFALGPVAEITASVNLGLNLEAFVVEEVEASPPLAAMLGPEESGTRLSVSSGCRDIVAGGEGLLASLELALLLLPGRKRRWF